MAKVKYSEFSAALDAAAALDGTETVVVIQDGVPVESTTQDIADLGGGGTTVVNKTVAEMQALALASGFTVGQLYKITDAGDLGLFFRAATTSKLENDGIRVMLCPAYYGTGENAGDGNNWLGVWNANLTPAAGDLAIWGGLVWRNLTDAVGSFDSDIALDGTNWQVVAKSSFAASEYTPLIFGCSYDLTNNWISRQWDAAGNVFGIDFFTEENNWGFGFNPCDASDWNWPTNGQLFYGNKCIGVWNNVSSVGIYENHLFDGIINSNDTNSDIAQNYGNASISAQTTQYRGSESPKLVINRNDNFIVSGPNGTTFTDTGSSGQINAEFIDNPIGWEFSFFVTDNGIELNPGAVGHTIQFWDGSVSRNTPLVLLGAPGKSITIRKISATVWAGIAVNGAVDND